MYFQIESGLKEKLWKFDILTIKASLGLGIFTKNYFPCVCQNNNLLHVIPIPSFFHAQQKGIIRSVVYLVIAGLQKVYPHFSVMSDGLV